jgi:hypothetical protein
MGYLAQNRPTPEELDFVKGEIAEWRSGTGLVHVSCNTRVLLHPTLNDRYGCPMCHCVIHDSGLTTQLRSEEL